MKLAKVLPAMAALVVLSACASDAPKMEIKGKKTDKIVVKNCDVDAKATAKANQ